MTDAQILEAMTDIFRQIFDDDSIALTPSTTANDIPDWDSMNHVSIVVATEARFGVKFLTAEIEQLKNVGDFVALIRRKLGPAA
jgi:acyl carrier protein